jgi:hypothetical protein
VLNQIVVLRDEPLALILESVATVENESLRGHVSDTDHFDPDGARNLIKLLMMPTHDVDRSLQRLAALPPESAPHCRVRSPSRGASAAKRPPQPTLSATLRGHHQTGSALHLCRSRIGIRWWLVRIHANARCHKEQRRRRPTAPENLKEPSPHLPDGLVAKLVLLPQGSLKPPNSLQMRSPPSGPAGRESTIAVRPARLVDTSKLRRSINPVAAASIP